MANPPGADSQDALDYLDEATERALANYRRAKSPITGAQRPRLCSIPPGRVSSSGGEAIDLARKAGLVLDDWESWVLDQALAERADGNWTAFEIALIVSRQNGKGSILEARELFGLFLAGEQLLIHTAHEFKTAQEAFRRIRLLIENTPDLDRRVAKMPESHGEEGIELLPKWGGGRLRFIARSGGSGRGFTGDLLVYDEAMFLQAAAVAASLPTLSARPNPQVWYTGSAGLKVKGKAVSTQLARVRRRGAPKTEGRRWVTNGDPDLFFSEWSIDAHGDYCEPRCAKHDDPDEVASWARANPALGVVRMGVPGDPAARNPTGLSVEHVAREHSAMDPESFGNERLGVGFYPTAADDWAVIPRSWWEATLVTPRDENGRSTHQPARPVCAIDATPDRSASAIGVCGDGGGGGRAYVEISDYGAGMGWLVARAREIDRRHSPLAWVVDKRGAAGSVIGDLELAGLAVLTPDATEVGYACGQFYDAVKDDLLAHADDREVTRGLAGASTRPLGGQWAWDRVNSSVDICPLVAITLAHWGYVKLTAESNYDAAQSVHFDVAEIARLWSLGAYGPYDIARLYLAGIINDAGLTELGKRGVAIPVELLQEATRG